MLSNFLELLQFYQSWEKMIFVVSVDIFLCLLLNCWVAVNTVSWGTWENKFCLLWTRTGSCHFYRHSSYWQQIVFPPRPQNHKHGSVSIQKLFCTWPSYCLPHLTPDIQHFKLCRRSERKEILDTNIRAVCLVLSSLKKKIWRPFESLKEIFDKKKFWTKGWVLWFW